MRSTKLFLAILLSLAAVSTSFTQETFWVSTGGPLRYFDVRCLAVNSMGHVFAGTWTDGSIWKSTDNGSTWAQCAPIPDPNPVLYISVDASDYLYASMFLRGVYRSTDGGATWELKNNGLTDLTVREGLIDNLNYVWVTTESGIFRSTDHGNSWTMKRPGFCSWLCLDSAHAIVYNDGVGPYLNRSIDHGETWESALTQVAILGVHPDGSYYAINGSNSISRSTDHGANWVDTHTPVNWGGYTAHITFNSRGDVYYARCGESSGVLRSTDHGSTWEILNDGLGTRLVWPIIRTADGYVFTGTVGSGIYRSRYSTTQPTVLSVTVPQVNGAAGSPVEIPVLTSDVTGAGIFSYQFVLKFNSPDSILNFSGLASQAGTLSNTTGWQVSVNSTVPNQVTVGAYGPTPLSGSGKLVALTFNILPDVAPGWHSDLKIENFLFNDGTPAAHTADGEVSVAVKTCGDADENGLVQAFDAALTLRDAIGPFPSPPPPLTAQGKLNSDVDVDGSVTAYDAALILREVIGLPMPGGVLTCFGGGGPNAPAKIPPGLQVTVAGVERGVDQTVVFLRFSGFTKESEILSLAMNLSISAGDLMSASAFPGLPTDYMGLTNRVTDKSFRIGVIHPAGITPGDLVVSLTAGRAESLDAIMLTNIRMNTFAIPDIALSGVVSGVSAKDSPIPSAFRLIGCYPNPFNPSTTIVFELPAQSHIRMEIFDAAGMLVRTLADRPETSGRHEIVWDGTNSGGTVVASGEYFCRIQAGRYVSTIKLLTLK